MAKKKQKKIVRYRKPLNLNVGMIVFAVIFVYLVFSVTTYLRKEKVQFYEVVEGSIVNDKIRTGIILRNEEIQYSDRSGYINYYVGEGKRASVGTSVCSIDESGTLASALSENEDLNINLTEEDVLDIRKQLSNFSLGYRDSQFHDVYDIKYSMEAAVLEHVNFNALDKLESTMESMGVHFSQVKAPKSGVISYAIDSYEGLTPEQISETVFDRTNYNRAFTTSGALVESGTPLYKIVTDDKWSVVFPMTEQDIADFGTETSLKVSFPGHSLTTTGAFSMITGTDGKPYGKLDFSKYMIQFISDRYIDIEILSHTEKGLKIPISAVTTENFYLVPVDYLTTGGNSQDSGFQKEVYSENGTSIVFTPATIYYSTDEYYYIKIGEDEELKAGDYVVKPNSSDRYQIGPTASLEGVYNINKGYTIFKQIEILSQNDEYYTVKEGTSYGLSVYDHIVLDASVIEKEGVLIYQ